MPESIWSRATRWLLPAILSVYAVLATMYAVYTPPWQAPDEPAHYNYVRFLSEQARSDKERDYQQKLKDFQRFTKDIREELQRSDADYTRQILEKILKVVGEMGEKQGYTVILEKSESSLLYADDKIDLTDAVIKAFDEQY